MRYPRDVLVSCESRWAYYGLLAALNQGNPWLYPGSRDRWNLAQFDRQNYPVHLGRMRNPDTFSEHRGTRLRDLCLKMPGDKWAIPDAVTQFTSELLPRAYAYETFVNPEAFDNSYVYLTVDQKAVPPGGTQRREGWHADGFLTEDYARDGALAGQPVDRTYLAYDALPTLFWPGPFHLPPNPTAQQALQHFQATAGPHWREALSYPSYHILCLTPYDVHRVAVNATGHAVARTFAKLTFSRHRFNRAENDRNPELDYAGWDWVPRGVVRNTPVATAPDLAPVFYLSPGAGVNGVRNNGPHGVYVTFDPR